MSSFVDYLRARLPLVNERLAAASARPLTSEGVAVDLERYLYEPLAHFTAEGGKRVRPVLCLMGAEAAGGNAEVALAPAVAIELFQSAALIHDDIADASELRRGEPCLYKTQGVGVATNMGDLALVQVIDVVLQDAALPEERKPEVLRRLVEMELHTLEGQALDLGWARDERWDVTTGDYVYMVTSKTGLVLGGLAAAHRRRCRGRGQRAQGGSAQGGPARGDRLPAAGRFAEPRGDAEAQGKDFRSDITEGKRTLAVVHALENLGATERTSSWASSAARPPRPPRSPGPWSSSSLAAASSAAAILPQARWHRPRSSPMGSSRTVSSRQMPASCYAQWRSSL